MRRKTILRLETLEERLLLNGQTDFLINSTLTGNQLNPAVAADGSGRFVVAWEGLNPANGTSDVYAQREGADGTPLGGEILVNANTGGNQQFAKVAADAAGDFVVVWRGPNPANNLIDLWGRAFNSSGQPVTGDVLLDPGSENLDSGVQVAMDPAGDRIVVTRTSRLTGSSNVYAELYDGGLNALGSAFAVSPAPGGTQSTSRVAMDAAGNFTVSWNAFGSLGLQVVQARRFDAQGNPLTSTLAVSGNSTAGNQTNLALALAPDGGFLSLWDVPDPTTHNLKVIALRYSAANQPGTPLTVSDPATTADAGAAGFDATGASVIVWQTKGAGSPAQDGIHLQRYDASGNPSGPAALLNSVPASDGSPVALAESGDGAALSAWAALNPDGTTDIRGTLSAAALQPPVLTSLTGTTSGNEGDTFSFHAAATSPMGDALTYSWDLNGDGVFGDATGTDVQTVFTAVGQHSVTVQVSDAHNQSVLGSLGVAVVNVAPTALPGPTQTINEGSTADFQGSANDPGAADETYTYAWDFDYDGQNFNAQAFGPAAQHFFAEAGTYTVALRVFDGNGGVGIGVTRVTVLPVGPTASAGADQSVVEGTPVTLHGTVSDPDLALDTFTYSWVVTEGGSVVATGATPDLTFTPADSGTYQATFTVTDESGASGSSSATVTVTDAPLSAEPVNVQAAQGADTGSVPVATFTDAGVPEAPGDYTALIDWGDGTVTAGSVSLSGTTFTVSGSHTYAEEGSFPVQVTVSEDGGSSASAAGTATVADAPLLAGFVAPSPVAGAPFSGVVASFTDLDPNGSVGQYTATITWGDGSTTAGTVTANGHGGFDVSGANTYAAPGSYSASVRIADVGGASITVQGTISVSDAGVGIQAGQARGVGFWHNHKGQALLTSFNGGPNATALGNWLAATLPNLFGKAAGGHDLTGKTNAQVASFYLGLFATPGARLTTEVLATALNVYATTLSLGGQAGQAHGFRATDDGLGASDFSVGFSGGAFGVANFSSLNVYQALQAANRQAANGVPWNGNRLQQVEARVTFAAINALGEDSVVDLLLDGLEACFAGGW